MDLTETYKRTLKDLRKVDTTEYSEQEKAHINAMISNCEYIVRWLTCGHRPDNVRGIERYAAYQREYLVDPLMMQSYYYQSATVSPSNITDSDRKRIEEALNVLTPRERECYMMAHGQGFSFEYIANLLAVKKSTVQTFVERAQLKLSQKYTQMSLDIVV